MDLTDAFIILRNATNAGTRGREALEVMDDCIYKLAGERDEARAEVAAWRALGVSPETARLCVEAVKADVDEWLFKRDLAVALLAGGGQQVETKG